MAREIEVEMRGAIARWTPEGRVYFDNRYHQRRCYRLSYRSAPHTVNGQQIERKLCAYSPRTECLCRNGSFFFFSTTAASKACLCRLLSPFYLSFPLLIHTTSVFFSAEPAFKPLCGYYITNDSFQRTRE